jgi:hypothetical protein
MRLIKKEHPKERKKATPHINVAASTSSSSEEMAGLKAMIHKYQPKLTHWRVSETVIESQHNLHQCRVTHNHITTTTEEDGGQEVTSLIGAGNMTTSSHLLIVMMSLRVIGVEN